MQDFDAVLEDIGVLLPEANPAAANYLPYIQHNGLLYISGQTCKLHGRVMHTGVLGEDYSAKHGYMAAKLCAINMLAQVKHACGGTLNKIEQCIRITVYMQCHKEFSEQALVANGASDFIVKLFGEKGKHARSAVGCSALPASSTVEIDAIFAINQP